jgi:hypothetical protein
MPSVVQRKNPNSRRGRPRKVYPRLTHRVSEWDARTGWSRSKTFEQMAAGKLRYRQDHSGGPREIFTTEYVRLGFVRSLDELN